MQLTAFAKRYCTLRGDELVAGTRTAAFPYFATRSEIAERVLQGDRDALECIGFDANEHKRALAADTRLRRAHAGELSEPAPQGGISVLCDVRRTLSAANTASLKTRWRVGARAWGSGTKHLPELGIAAERRQSSRRRRTMTRSLRSTSAAGCRRRPGR